LFAALGVFVYQTFDAVDGKQARRTGTSSALGNLLDHGCDSVAIILITFLYAEATDQTFTQAVWSQFSIQCCCFCAQWEDSHRHVLRTGFYLLGVTEGQLFTQMILVSTMFYGPAYWKAAPCPILSRLPFPLEGLTWQGAFGLVYHGVNILIGLQCTFGVITTARVRDWIQQLGPFLVHASALATLTILPEVTHPRTMIFGCGLVSSYMQCNVIVCSSVEMAFPSRRCLFAALPVWPLLALLATGIVPAESQGVVCGMYLMYAVALFWGFARAASEEIAAYLGVNIFSIRARRD
jgi:ethanolaminephosphotransferase